MAGESADLWDTIQHTAKGLQVTLVTGNIKWSLIIIGIFDKWLPAGHELFFRAKYPVFESSGNAVEGNVLRAKKGDVQFAKPDGFLGRGNNVK